MKTKLKNCQYHTHSALALLRSVRDVTLRMRHKNALAMRPSEWMTKKTEYVCLTADAASSVSRMLYGSSLCFPSHQSQLSVGVMRELMRAGELELSGPFVLSFYDIIVFAKVSYRLVRFSHANQTCG